MARAELILFSRFPGTHQITQRFVRGIWNPDRRQIASAVTTRQFLGVAAIGLHPVAGLGGNQRRSHYFARHPKLGELPVQNIARRPRLIADLQMLRRSQLADQLADRLQSVRDDPHRTHFPIWLGDRHCDRLGVDIQTYKAYFRHWRPAPFVCGSAPLDLPLRSLTRACYESVVGRSIVTKDVLKNNLRAATVLYCGTPASPERKRGDGVAQTEALE